MNVIVKARELLIILALGAAIGTLLWEIVIEGRWEPASSPILPSLGD